MKTAFIILTLAICTTADVFAERAISVIQRTDNYDRKVALVIGNSAYKSSPLKNPLNDAQDVASLLGELGFQVTVRTDASQRQMRKAIREFGNQLKKGGVGLFFFAGHGMQVNGRNYLLPVDADIQEEDEVQDYAVDAGLVFLDACRDNPFARSFRSSQKGLAQMDAPRSSLIVYATAPGSVAADGSGRNGVFTKYLLKYMSRSGVEVGMMLRNVRIDVLKETRDKQIPWDSSSLTGTFFFSGGRISGESVASVSTSPGPEKKPQKKQKRQPSKDEREMWDMVKVSNDIDELKLYVEAYPNGYYRQTVEQRIWELSHVTFDSYETYLKSNPEGQFRSRAEDKIWSIVVATNNIEQLERYIERHPKSRYKAQAREKLWHIVRDSNEINQMDRYIDRYPNSRYRGLAKLKLKRLNEEERKKRLEEEKKRRLLAEIIVVDQSTLLMWQKGEPGDMRWQAAINYCSELTLAGYSDWRLPNKGELKSASKINSSFPNIPKPWTTYWSSTSDNCGDQEPCAWGAHPKYGGFRPVFDKVRNFDDDSIFFSRIALPIF